MKGDKNEKKNNKIFLSFFVILMFVSSIPIMVGAATLIESGPCRDNNVTWNFYSDGTLIFTGTGSIYDNDTFVMDWEETEYGAAGSSNHRANDTLRIHIPAGINYIESTAFNSCFSLEDITIDSNNPYYSAEDGVVFNKDKTVLITYPAYYTKTSYKVPATVKELGYEAFDGSRCLESIELPDGLKIIGSYAFLGCDALKGITIPDTVEDIGYCAFYGCSGLTEITIPAKVEFFSYNTVKDCGAIENIYVDDANEYYSDIDGVLYNKDQTTLVYYPGGRIWGTPEQRIAEIIFTIPETVTCVADSAFGEGMPDCLVIPENIVKFDHNNFPEYQLELYHFGYTGSEEQWNNIDFGDVSSEELSNRLKNGGAALHCNFNSETDFTVTEHEDEHYTSYSCSCGYNANFSYEEDISDDNGFDFFDFFFGWIVDFFNWLKNLFS